MRAIPATLRNEMESDPYYKRCCMEFRGECEGRITWEHALIFAGKQINEKWAIIPLCEFHHAVGQFQDAGDLKKEMNVWVALNRAIESELLAYSKAIDYVKLKRRLNEKYGPYSPT